MIKLAIILSFIASSAGAQILIGGGSGGSGGGGTTFNGGTITSSLTIVSGTGGLKVNGDSVTANAFYGDGSHLTGISVVVATTTLATASNTITTDQTGIGTTFTTIVGSTMNYTIGVASDPVMICFTYSAQESEALGGGITLDIRVDGLTIGSGSLGGVITTTVTVNTAIVGISGCVMTSSQTSGAHSAYMMAKDVSNGTVNLRCSTDSQCRVSLFEVGASATGPQGPTGPTGASGGGVSDGVTISGNGTAGAGAFAVIPTTGVLYDSSNRGLEISSTSAASISGASNGIVSTITATNYQFPSLAANPPNLVKGTVWMSSVGQLSWYDGTTVFNVLASTFAGGSAFAGGSVANTITETYGVSAATVVASSSITANGGLLMPAGVGWWNGTSVSSASFAGNYPTLFSDSTTVVSSGTNSNTSTVVLSTAIFILNNYAPAPGDTIVITCHFQNGGTSPTSGTQNILRNGTIFLIVQNQTTANQDVWVELRLKRASQPGVYSTRGQAWQVVGNGSGGAVTSQVVFNNSSKLLSLNTAVTADTWTCAGNRSAGGDINFMDMSVRRE